MKSIPIKVLLFIIIMMAGISLPACAAEPAGPPKVGIINSLDQVGEVTIEGFKARMADLGYVEGETIVYDIHNFEPAETDAIAAAVQAAVDRPADLIVTIGFPASVTAKQATAKQNIPILFFSGDPVGQGLIDNLRQPGGNMTGVTTSVMTSDTEGRRLEWVKQIKPDVERIYVLHNPDDAGMIRAFENVQAAATDLDIEMVFDAPSSQAELDAIIANFPQDVEVFFPLPDRRVVQHVPALIKLSLERKFIFSTPVLGITRAGGLMAFGSDYDEIGKQMARLADQIFKGANPGELPVEEPEILLNVNLKTAEAIGVEIPDEVLRAAYEIIR